MSIVVTDTVWRDGVLISSTPRTISDADLRGSAALARLQTGRAALRTLRTQAQTQADTAGTFTLAQLSNGQRQIAGALATIAQTLMDIELLLAWQPDDGAD